MDARRLGDLVAAGELLYSTTTGGATGAGAWVDVSNYDGDIAVSVVLHAVTGSGDCKVQLQTATDANGTGAANASASASVDPTAVGHYIFAVPINSLANKFVGVNVTLTGFTAVTISVAVVARKRIV